MKLKELNIANLGPIKAGRIRQNKINVFFGPNNSGKSMVSRLIHGINLAYANKITIPQRLLKKFVPPRDTDTFSTTVYLDLILQNSGINYADMASYGQRKCSIHAEFPRKSADFKVNTSGPRSRHAHASMLSRYITRRSAPSYDSVYIPAGRTGTIQFFTNITRIRNHLLHDLMSVLDGGRGVARTQKFARNEIKNFARLSVNLPGHLEQFYDIILSAHEEQSGKYVQELFSGLFPGNIEFTKSPSGLLQISYRDPAGFVTELESAGSGAVSAFPIIVGMHYVKQHGMLVVEEPEAHLEPHRQMRLIELLHEACRQKKTDIIFTTHSDYVVKKLLAMVSNKKIKNTDLGLYYFNRTNGLTTIEHIDIDRSGEAKQPIFQNALDDLVREFSE